MENTRNEKDILGNRIKFGFVVLFFLMILIPLCTTNFKSDKVSETEKRYLAGMPSIFDENGEMNDNFSSDFETWINDNLGMRSEFVAQNAKIQYYLFDVLADNSDMLLGPNGELNYAPPFIIVDYQHLNLFAEDSLNERIEGLQFASDWIKAKGIQFYYFQCCDKHSIYPEYFPNTVIQYGNVSKTDQLIEAMEKHTDVRVVYPKKALIEAKDLYDTYSEWGDATHWTPRGAYIGYEMLMNAINYDNGDRYNVLAEKDYNIANEDGGSTLFGSIHKECIIENFEILNPKAVLTNDKLTLYNEDSRHRFYTNEFVNNDTRLLVLGDSYFNDYLMDDLAESFHETIILWGDYVDNIEEILEVYSPDILVIENAERCDRTGKFAETMFDIKSKDEVNK